MEKEFYKTYLPISFNQRKNGSSQEAIANYLTPVDPGAEGDRVLSPNTILDKELDLFYGLSVLVSEGVNNNSDAFLRNILISIFKTPRHKFVDWEHDVHAEDKKNNPDKYQVIGHIYDSALAAQDGAYIPEYDVFKDSDGKWFSENSNWRDKALDIIVAWVIYKFEFPELVDKIIQLSIDSPDKFGVSMEVLFNDYKFRIGGSVNPAEDFNFDANSTGVREVRKGDPLADMFQEGWNKGKYRTWNGLPVIRILGGNIFFSGMAITSNRANKRSWNLSFAKDQVKEFKSEDLMKLVQAVAKKGAVDMSTCNIVNGEPDCDCLEKSISAEIESLGLVLGEIEQAVSAIKKRKGINPKTGEKKYGDVKYADETNNKYPIDTPAHIRAAWNYIHKKKNADKYSSSDVDRIKNKIIAAWKDRIDKNGPPSISKGSMWDCPYCQEDDMGSQDTNEDHMAYHMNDLENNLVRAQKKIQYLHENNLDGDLSQEELMEAVQEIEAILEDSQSCLDIIR